MASHRGEHVVTVCGHELRASNSDELFVRANKAGL
jgi:hypothetical protein